MSATPMPDGSRRATLAERVAWVIVCGGLVLFFVALVVFGNSSDEPDAPTVWMVVGGGLAAVALIPALLLTGVRQLFPLGAELRTGDHGRDSAGLDVS